MSNSDSSPPASRWNGPGAYASAPPPPTRVQSLHRSAAEALFRGRADLARAPIEELARAAAQDAKVQELAQHLARQASIVAFDWPAARENAVSPRSDPPTQDAIDLVAFHVDLPRAPSGIHAPIDYMGVLALSFESARLRAPS